MKSTPTNRKLYSKVTEDAKKKFKTWPSAYASAWVVKEYKRRNGKYKGSKPTKTGISRWMDEKWVNVCKLGKKVPCGRPKLSVSNWKKKYPYCRPSVKITSSTPTLASELSKSEIKKRCNLKHKSPMKRITSKRISRRKSKRSQRKSKRSRRKSKRSRKKSKRSRKKSKRSRRKSKRSRRKSKRSRSLRK